MTTPQIVTRAGWGARAPRGSVATTTWARRTGIAIHHSAGPTTQTVRSIQDHQMDRNGWQDIGYNWLVDQQGRVYEGRSGGWLAIGAHAANQNTAWIGICWIGNSGSTAPSAAALASIRWLVDEARRLAGRRLEVRGHGQVPGQATECPGARLRAWISDGMPVSPPADHGGSTMSVWKEQIPHSANTAPLWPGEQGKSAASWQRSQAIHALLGRRAAERGVELGEAILAAVTSGGDLPQILARIDAHHAQQMAAVAQLEQRLERAEAERAELAELVRQHASGQLPAAEVVRLMGELMSRAGQGGV